MKFSNQVTDFISGLSPSSLPHFIWQAYLEYLWFYESGSWVARIAYTFRVLAFVFIVPMVFITLLDVTSYIIARTLGIVDDVKASTSDKKTIHNQGDIPSIVLSDMTADTTPPSDFVSGSSTSNLQLPSETHQSEMAHPVPRHAPPQAYFASEDMQLKLSGEGLFSPAASQPPSPKLTRRQLVNQDRGTDEE